MAQRREHKNYGRKSLLASFPHIGAILWHYSSCHISLLNCFIFHLFPLQVGHRDKFVLKVPSRSKSFVLDLTLNRYAPLTLYFIVLVFVEVE